MRALWIAFVWPEPNSSAAGYRTLELIDILTSNGYEVEVISPCQDNRHRQELESRDIKTHHFLPNDSCFDEYIKFYNPDVVFFDRFMIEEQFSWRVNNNAPHSLRILDTIDIHSLRRTRQKALNDHKNVRALNNEEYFSDDAIRELASIFRSDVSLIISEYEYSFLRDIFLVPSTLLAHCTFSRVGHHHTPSFSERKNFVFIGNFNHAPNVDAVRLLHDSLWEEIRSELERKGVNEAELHIYGAYPSKEIESFDSQKKRLRVKGHISTLSQIFPYYRVNLAPLRFGAGIKGKIADGWSYGTPCCSTALGAEGMHGTLSFGGIVSENADNFAKNASLLYLDEVLWNSAQRHGAEIINTLFNPHKISKNFLHTLAFHLNNKDIHRKKNFIGQMLWHQQFRATEYFSRWIEAKNKLL